jgi:hypothetical protein
VQPDRARSRPKGRNHPVCFGSAHQVMDLDRIFLVSQAPSALRRRNETGRLSRPSPESSYQHHCGETNSGKMRYEQVETFRATDEQGGKHVVCVIQHYRHVHASGAVIVWEKSSLHRGRRVRILSGRRRTACAARSRAIDPSR